MVYAKANGCIIPLGIHSGSKGDVSRAYSLHSWWEEFELLDGNADIYFCDPSRCRPQSSAAADDLALRVQSSTKYNPLTKDTIIIRMHSVTTKKEAVAVTARRAGISSEPVDAEIRVGEAELLDIALMIYYAFSMAQEHPHGLKDRRSKLPELSIATWMLRVAGIIDNESPHPKANPTPYKRFADFFRRQAEGESFVSKERTEYTLCLNNQRAHTLRLADVVVTTVSNSGDVALCWYGGVYRGIYGRLT